MPGSAWRSLHNGSRYWFPGQRQDSSALRNGLTLKARAAATPPPVTYPLVRQGQRQPCQANESILRRRARSGTLTDVGAAVDAVEPAKKKRE